jgi:histone H4
MAGKGKTGKVAAKNRAKSTGRGEPKDSKNAVVTNGAIRRLARRGGVKRLSFAAHHHVRDYIEDFLNRVVRDTLTYT